MPELIEQMYCSQQIVIPPKFPYILKRYCKAAIKTQPYDLLRWSYEYFKAVAERRPPPVKLRLEYPIFSTEGGLTKGCLKVLANQLSPMADIPLAILKSAWRGFCLDHMELRRVLCLCEVYMRADSVPFLHFVAVAGGLLTKNLTHTMMLLCESLTKEPDGGSAAIPVDDFLTMYKFLATMDASQDIKYHDGYREGMAPEEETVVEEEETPEPEVQEETASDDSWPDTKDTQKIRLINDRMSRTTRLSVKMDMPIIGQIERSPSVERAGQIERENYMMERKGRARPSEDIDRKLREISNAKISSLDVQKEEVQETKVKEPNIGEEKKEEAEIIVYDEHDNAIPYELYGEPKIVEEHLDEEENLGEVEAEHEETAEPEEDIAAKISNYVNQCYLARQARYEDLEQTFEEISAIVDRFKSANYDLGMIAGRQMSTTSGEFIVQHIEREIMDYIDDQIAILPDPDLKKKKAKPEEVEMIRQMLETFLDENMDVIVAEVEEVEEEEQPIPEITLVYAVPGIGPVVDEDIINDFEEYALDVCKSQADFFMPRNIRHFMCPPLEKIEDQKYHDPHAEAEKNLFKEELATSGIITE